MKTRKNYWLLVLLLSLNIPFGKAQVIDDTIDNHISTLVDDMKFSGSVLVADSNGIIFRKGYGLSDIGSNTPNTTDTKFRIGSLTKQFTSMLIMQLVENGEIGLNEKIKDRMPELHLENNATVEQVLNHTSGIKDYTELDYKCSSGKGQIKPLEFAMCFNTLESEFPPGTALSYSNTNYYLLGLLIEKVTSKSYEENLKEHILNPLQMTDTGYSILDPTRFAQGYKKVGENLREANIEDINLAYTAGGMYSTVEDLYKWNLALSSDKLISKKNRELIFRENANVDPGYYGFGWFVDEDHYEFKDHRAFHEGGINGFSACIDRYLNSRVCIIVLSNYEFSESRVDLTEPITKIIFSSKN